MLYYATIRDDQVDAAYISGGGLKLGLSKMRLVGMVSPVAAELENMKGKPKKDKTNRKRVKP